MSIKTQQATRALIRAEGEHHLEELAMAHMLELAERLEKHYGAMLKQNGLTEVDYFLVARTFAENLFQRLDRIRNHARTPAAAA